MRTIKFRGKQACLYADWKYGNLCGVKSSLIEEIINDKNRGNIYSITRVIPETVGQFIGLLDKNGKEIYEGDILRKPAKNQWEIKNFVGYEVFWHDNDCADNHIGWQMNRHHYYGCLCGTTDFVRCLPKYCSQMEIIGNIHDNPELIKA